jgi:hypothetical protein
MWVRSIARSFAVAVAVFALACSGDENRRDQNFGTDLGAGYQLPDGGPEVASPSDAHDTADGGAADADTDAAGPDAAPDAPVGTAPDAADDDATAG